MRFAVALVAAAFVLHARSAASSYLNVDEIGHFMLANAASLLEACKAAAAVDAHPPLFILILHWILKYGSSELLLRLPSVFAGTGALWFAYRWLRKISGDAAALLGLAFLAFSPAAVSAFTEARSYGLMLYFICAALYFLEEFLSDDEPRALYYYSLHLYGAILSEFTALWTVAALGLYAALRLRFDGKSPRLAAKWAAVQGGGALIYAFLYLTQIRFLHGGRMETEAIGGWLSASYPPAGAGATMRFAARAGRDIFIYAAGSTPAAWLTLACFAAGLAALFLPPRRRRDHALLLILPFILGCLGAVLHWLPFGGTRHVDYLLPFIAAGASLGATTLLPKKIVPAACLLLGFYLCARPPDNDPRRRGRQDMAAALTQIKTSVPKGSVIIVDHQTRALLRYYLPQGGYRLVAPGGEAGAAPRREPAWTLTYRRPGADAEASPFTEEDAAAQWTFGWLKLSRLKASPQ